MTSLRETGEKILMPYPMKQRARPQFFCSNDGVYGLVKYLVLIRFSRCLRNCLLPYTTTETLNGVGDKGNVT